MNSKDFRALVSDAVAAGRARVDRPETSERARWVLADTVSVAIAAGRRPAAIALVADDILTGRWRHPVRTPDHPALLLTEGGGYAATDRAAYVNGSIIGDLELDEGVRPTGHPAAHVLPAVLASAQALDSTLGEALDALVVGYEVAATLFETYTLTPGIHPHGHLGTIGAAVAVSHLCGDDPLPAAAAAAALPLLTTWGPCLDGATVRNTWMGYSASTGVSVQRLVRVGWGGSTQTLESAFGGIVATRRRDLAHRELPRITGGYFKLHSACALTHSGIDAASTLAPLEPEDIDRVTVRTTANNMKVDAFPADAALSRRFSIPFTVAAALTRGAVTVEIVDTPSPLILDLTRRVVVVEDADFTAAWPSAAPAHITVEMKNGRTLTARCDNALGTPARPVDEAQLRDKSAGLLGDGGRAWNRLTTAPEEASVGEVLTELHPTITATA